MRKGIKSLLLIAAAAMTFTSCQKEDKAQVNDGKGTVKVNFTSVADGTKTYFGDRTTDKYPTLWTGDEKVGITYLDANIDKEKNVVKVNGKGETTTFSTELTAVDGAGTVYVFAPWYPGDFKDKDAGGFTNYNGTNKNANVVIPTTQVSTPESCDPRAQLLVAKYDFTSGVEENVDVNFTHATAYGKVTINGVDAKIKTVKIDFGQNVTGTGIYYYTADSEKYSAKAGDLKAGTSYNQTYVEIDNNGYPCDKTFWFGIPAISCEGKTVVVTVTDENDKEYTKAITSESKVLKFEQGKISSFTVTVAPKSEEKTYISIKDLRAKGETTITEDLYVKGYVISDASSNNFNEQNLVISDGEAGITVRFSAQHSYTTIGQEVEVSLNGLTLSKFNDLLQINNVPASNVTATTNTKVLEPKEITVEQLLSGNYESMYVLIKDVQVTNDDLQKKMNNSINMEQRDGGKFVMYFRNAYINANETVPQGCGNLMGIASIFKGTMQIIPNNASDYAGLTGERFGDAPVVDDVICALTFPDENKDNNSVDAYDGEWTAKSGAFEWTMKAFNNHGWKDNWSWIKCGSKKFESTATITTNAAMSDAIKAVNVTVDKYTAVDGTTTYLQVASTKDGLETAAKVEVTMAKGVLTYNIATPQPNMFYRITYYCPKGSSNGYIRISKVEYVK